MQDPSIYDIEVCTLQRRRAERLGHGFDPRYNAYVYQTLGHDRFVDRFFVPLLLVRDRDNCALRQEQCVWTQEGDSWTPSAGDYQLQAIGTFSVANEQLVDPALFRTTLDFATNIVAPIAHRASIQGLSEQILTLLVQHSGADSATLHLADDTDTLFSSARTHLVFQPGMGVSIAPPTDVGPGAVPRCDGIGAEALSRQLPVRFSGRSLAAKNPELAAAGLAATDAFPLLSAEGRSIGLLYLHYLREPPKLSTELTDLVTFAAHPLDLALRSQRRSLVRERALAEGTRLATGSSESLEDRVWAMANFAWNLLGCDHVSVVVDAESVQRGHDRLVRSAGRYLSRVRGAGVTDGEDGSLLESLRMSEIPRRPVYISSDARKKFGRDGFANRENIEASAILPLLAEGSDETAIGMLVVDYRADVHPFEEREQDLLERLASFFAAGILMFRGKSEYRGQVFRSAARLQREQLPPVSSALQLHVALDLNSWAPPPPHSNSFNSP